MSYAITYALEPPCSCNGNLKYAHRKCVQHWVTMQRKSLAVYKVQSKKGLKILICDLKNNIANTTTNVVYNECVTCYVITQTLAPTRLLPLVPVSPSTHKHIFFAAA
ncbi:hypothetical protein QVD17_11775 [Tagetes erecta]|uniref:RING-CH-type domain-containing protein n=1 Tax=Tagetes erecta TaxID=13708 RepID=A0AAD8KUX7_TARER|nr:hypothetical protein QVD17_11775 [Tagetes erecta]